MPTPDDQRARAMSGTEADGFALMTQGAGVLIDGVARLGPAWVVRSVTALIDAWGKLDDDSRAGAIAAASVAGERAATRVETELRSLFELDPAAQRATPLEIIRSLFREASEVLRAAGVPAVVRDPFETRAFPDDPYGIVLKNPAELGDDELGGALLAWGLGKAKVLRSRAGGDAGPSGGTA
ncbi:MAG: hypothetical protein M3Q30_25265 [Actinomycetota bacterium]|nr:hypothetical protein [Actinomycetota bacterium]